jgi:hypothetical protein
MPERLFARITSETHELLAMLVHKECARYGIEVADASRPERAAAV